LSFRNAVEISGHGARADEDNGAVRLTAVADIRRSPRPLLDRVTTAFETGRIWHGYRQRSPAPAILGRAPLVDAPETADKSPEGSVRASGTRRSVRDRSPGATVAAANSTDTPVRAVTEGRVASSLARRDQTRRTPFCTAGTLVSEILCRPGREGHPRELGGDRRAGDGNGRSARMRCERVPTRRATKKALTARMGGHRCSGTLVVAIGLPALVSGPVAAIAQTDASASFAGDLWSRPRLTGRPLGQPGPGWPARRHPRPGFAPDAPGLTSKSPASWAPTRRPSRSIGVGSWRKCTPSRRGPGSDDRSDRHPAPAKIAGVARGWDGPADIGPKPHIFRSGNQSRLGPTRSSFPAESAAQTLARGSLAKGHGRRGTEGLCDR